MFMFVVETVVLLCLQCSGGTVTNVNPLSSLSVLGSELVPAAQLKVTALSHPPLPHRGAEGRRWAICGSSLLSSVL